MKMPTSWDAPFVTAASSCFSGLKLPAGWSDRLASGASAASDRLKLPASRKARLGVGAAALLGGAAIFALLGGDGQNAGDVPLGGGASAKAASSESAAGRVVAGRGVVEPESGIVELSARMPGVIEVVNKLEGASFKRGEILAELFNDDLKALLAQAEANVRIEAARLALVKNGPRPEEISQAEAAVREESSSIKLYQAQVKRRAALVEQGAVARERLDEAQRELTASQERLVAAKERLDILRQGARAEELETARGTYELAQDKVDEARAMLEKSYVRAPIDGTVLRLYLQPGEALSTQPAIAVLQIGDTSRLAVRTQVDEHDISGLKVGQKVTISAPALEGKTLKGVVTRISPRLGAKTLTAEAPAEKRDTRVLDVIVALEPNVALPVNLRVDVVIDLDSVAEQSSLRVPLETSGCSSDAQSGCAPALNEKTAAMFDQWTIVSTRL